MSATIGSASFLWASGAALAGTASTTSARLGSLATPRNDRFTLSQTGDTASMHRPLPFFARGDMAEGAKGGAESSPNAILNADRNDPHNRAQLVELLSHADMMVRWNASNRLGQLREKSAVNRLYRMALRDSSTSVRLGVIRSLERIGTEKAARRLALISACGSCETSRSQALSCCRFLSDTNDALKEIIVTVLRKIRTDEARAALNAITHR